MKFFIGMGHIYKLVLIFESSPNYSDISASSNVETRKHFYVGSRQMTCNENLQFSLCVSMKFLVPWYSNEMTFGIWTA